MSYPPAADAVSSRAQNEVVYIPYTDRTFNIFYQIPVAFYKRNIIETYPPARETAHTVTICSPFPNTHSANAIMVTRCTG